MLTLFFFQSSLGAARPIFFEDSSQFPETKLFEFTEPFNLSIPKESYVLIQSSGIASAYIYTSKYKTEFKGELAYDFREFLYSGQSGCYILVPTDCHISIAVTRYPSNREFHFFGEVKCKHKNLEITSDISLYEAEVTQKIKDANIYLSKTSQHEKNLNNLFLDSISNSAFQSLIFNLNPGEIVTIPFISQFQTFIVRSSQQLLAMAGVMECDVFKACNIMSSSDFVLNDNQYRAQEKRMFVLKNLGKQKASVSVLMVEYFGRACANIREKNPTLSSKEKYNNLYLFNSQNRANIIGDFEDLRDKIRKQQPIKTFSTKVKKSDLKNYEITNETEKIAKLFEPNEETEMNWSPVDELEEEENEIQPKGLIEWETNDDVSGTVYRRPMKETIVEVMPHLHNRMKTDGCGILFFPNGAYKPDSLIVESGKHIIQTITNQSIGVNLGLQKPTVYVQTSRSTFSYYCAKMTLDEKMFAMKDQTRSSINQLRMSFEIKEEIAKQFRKRELHYSNMSLFEEFKVVLPKGSRYFFIDEPFMRVYFGDTQGYNISFFKVLDRDGSTKVIRLCRHYHEGQSTTGFNFGPHRGVIRISKNEDFGQSDISFVLTSNFYGKEIYNIRMSDIYLSTDNVEPIKFYTDISRKRKLQGK